MLNPAGSLGIALGYRYERKQSKGVTELSAKYSK
jgi:hypothetical protein